MCPSRLTSAALARGRDNFRAQEFDHVVLNVLNLVVADGDRERSISHEVHPRHRARRLRARRLREALPFPNEAERIQVPELDTYMRDVMAVATHEETVARRA